MSNSTIASSSAEDKPGTLARVGLWAGPMIFAIMLVLPPPEGLSQAGWRALAVIVLMVVWWVSECIPIAVTALLPLLLFPLLHVMPIRKVAEPYSEPVVFLFIGGLLIALCFERWRVHARLALMVASSLGTKPNRLLAATMISTILLSMWISNTATTLMMMPIALGLARSIYAEGEFQQKFASALVLGVAYAATIGGISTPIGTPPNLIALAFLERQGLSVSFLDWMAMAIPIVLVLAPAAWWVLARTLPPSEGDVLAAQRLLRSELAALGPMSTAERRLIVIFAFVASAWVLRGWLNTFPALSLLTDPGIAIAGAVALFLMPAGDPRNPHRMLANWDLATKLPWGIVLLYGGGLAIAASMEATDLAAWLGQSLTVLNEWPMMLIVAALVAVTVWASELMSNTATLTSLLPIVAAVTVATGVDPRYVILPVTIAASFGFMLPVSTPSNSIAYGSGFVKQQDMFRAGWRLNVYSIVITTLLGYLLVPLVL